MAGEESSLRLIGCNRNAVRRAARRLLRRKLRELEEKEEIELLEQVTLPEDADLERAMPLSPGDVETVEELDLDGLPTAWVEFSPEFHLRKSGISDDAIHVFAGEFNISDLASLRLTFAYAAKAVEAEGEPSDYAHLWRGQALDATHESYGEWQRADELSWDLHELVRKAEWPVGMAEPALRLLAALRAYGDWLAESDFTRIPKSKSRPPMSKQAQVVIYLALAWYGLTGKKPTVYPPKDGQKQLSLFHRASLRMCGLFGLQPPHASSIRTWKKAAESVRVRSVGAAKSEES